MRFALLLLLVAGTLTAAPVPKEWRQTTDKQRIVGLWVDQPKSAWFQFARDGTLQTWQGETREHLQNWTWEIVDQSATPKKAKINRTSPGNGSFDCVYELTGDGLKFALIMFPEKGPVTKVEQQHPALQYFETTRTSK